MADVVKVTNKGQDITTAALVASDAKWVAWGVLAESAAAITDTDLESEQDSRVAGTQSQQEGDVANDTYRVVGTVTAGASRTIKEMGIFDAEAAGNLYLRATFADIGVNENDKVQFTTDVKYADGS